MADVAGEPRYRGRETTACQFSVYPLRQTDIDGPIQAAIHAARAEGCSARVGNLSTLLSGSEDEVFRALRSAFQAAQRFGPAVVAATLATGMPSDELIGEIQAEVDARVAATGTATVAAVEPRSGYQESGA
jgi:uncharacterized protein YqgV (UPF0045/DUF77 family)